MTTNETDNLPVVQGERPMPDPSISLGNGVISLDDWSTLKAIAMTVVQTEFVPVGLRGSQAKVMAALLYGREQGMQPMASLSEINVIDGKPGLSAAMQAAKIRAAGHSLKREEIRDDAGNVIGARAIGKRNDDSGDEDSYEFTIEMARRAGLLSKKNWQNYPEAMCWARACSQLATFLFSDVFMGSPYTPEELGDDSDITTNEAVAELEVAPEPKAEPVEELAIVVVEGAMSDKGTGENLAGEVVKLDRAPIVALIRAGDEVHLTGAEPVEVPAGHVALVYDDETLAFTTDVETAEKLIDSQPIEGGEPEPQPPAAVTAPVDAEQLTLEALANEKVDVILKMAVGKPLAWLKGYRDYEAAHKARTSLLTRLDAMIEVTEKDAANQEPEDEPVIEGEVVFDKDGLVPVDGDVLPIEDAEFEPAPEPVETAEDTPLQKLERAVAFMAKHHPQRSEWEHDQLCRTASQLWQREIVKLDDLSDIEVGKILEALAAAEPEAVA